MNERVAQAQQPAAPTADHVHPPCHIEQHVEARGQTPVRDHQAPAVGVVEPAGHHRAVVVSRTPHVGGAGIEGDPQSVPVAREARPQGGREPRQAAAVGEQQPGRAERPGGEDDVRRLQRAASAALEVSEGDPPALALARRRLQAGDEVQRADLSAMGLRARDIGDVDRVLRVNGAAEIAKPKVLTALL